MTALRTLVLPAALLLAAAILCQQPARADDAKTNKLEPATCGDTKPLHTLGPFFLAGQPGRDDFDALKKKGVATVIDLRHAKETDLDEKELVTSLGMQYHHLPFKAPEELTPEVFDKARELLRTAKRPILLHCSSANRVGAVWIPFRVLDQGLALEQAVREAETMGLRTPEYEQRARVYVENAAPKELGTYQQPIAPAVRHGVNVVYQIKTVGSKDGVAAGLHYLDKLARSYDAMEIKPADRGVVGVFHGDAGFYLLNDPAYRKASPNESENPNKEIVRRLLESGVKLELCRSTMESHGWTGDDVLPGVKIVVGAYPRIIDLQLRGYAYIRF